MIAQSVLMHVAALLGKQKLSVRLRSRSSKRPFRRPGAKNRVTNHAVNLAATTGAKRHVNAAMIAEMLQ